MSEQEGDQLTSLAERPLEGLRLCLQKNHQNQVCTMLYHGYVIIQIGIHATKYLHICVSHELNSFSIFITTKALYKRLLKEIDKALEVNQMKRQDLTYPVFTRRRRSFTFWKFYRGSYFKDHKGRVGWHVDRLNSSVELCTGMCQYNNICCAVQQQLIWIM